MIHWNREIAIEHEITMFLYHVSLPSQERLSNYTSIVINALLLSIKVASLMLRKQKRQELGKN